jgi:hypothetical protein
MTTQAQLPDRAIAHSPRHDLPTDGMASSHPDGMASSHPEGMASSHPFIVDPYILLDHRTRERLISKAGAPAGRYLSFEHDGETMLIALERPITHVGRGLIADVRLEDSQVSRRHAILAVRGEGARILDDRSCNGTFVNGRRVTVEHLTDGDVVRFGRAVFGFTEITPRRSKPQSLRRISLVRRARHLQPSGPAAA